MMVLGTSKCARSPLFLIHSPLVWNQTGWSPHQIFLKNSSRTSHTRPPATCLKLWRTRVLRPQLLHRPQSNREHLGSGIAPTASPFLQTLVRWSLLWVYTCTLPCTPARPTPLRSVLRHTNSRTLRSLGLWHIVQRPSPSGALRTRTRKRRT